MNENNNAQNIVATSEKITVSVERDSASTKFIVKTNSSFFASKKGEGYYKFGMSTKDFCTANGIILSDESKSLYQLVKKSVSDLVDAQEKILKNSREIVKFSKKTGEWRKEISSTYSTDQKVNEFEQKEYTEKQADLKAKRETRLAQQAKDLQDKIDIAIGQLMRAQAQSKAA